MEAAAAASARCAAIGPFRATSPPPYRGKRAQTSPVDGTMRGGGGALITSSRRLLHKLIKQSNRLSNK